MKIFIDKSNCVFNKKIETIPIYANKVFSVLTLQYGHVCFNSDNSRLTLKIVLIEMTNGKYSLFFRDY